MARPKPIIIAGTRYGNLVTTGVYIPSYVDGNKYIKSKVECKCDCGSITMKILENLRFKLLKCCSRKCIYYGNLTHGKARFINGKQSKEYNAWKHMMHYCINPSKYNNAKGITYHESLSTIEGFLEIVGEAPSKYHRFDRIDKDGDFEPDNVHWYLSNRKKVNKT